MLEAVKKEKRKKKRKENLGSNEDAWLLYPFKKHTCLNKPL